MKNAKAKLKSEVERLVESSVIETAINRSLIALEEAINGLDPQSKKLIELYFEGKNINHLSLELGLSVPELSNWILKIKQEISQNVRLKFPIKQ
jgi:DNA-directed RNA polymerase specialized sigma24 family protein